MSETTFHGTELVVTKSKLDARISKEYLGELDGSGADQDFYTANFPITTSLGVTTDDETEVLVYTNDGVEGTFTQYLQDGSDYVIDGSEGLVTIKAAENQAGNAGEKIYIDYYTYRVISRGQAIKVTEDGNVVDVHELGNRSPQELKEGKIVVGGVLDQFYINRDSFGGILGLRGLNKRLSEFDVYLDPNGTVSGQPRIHLDGTKFTGGQLGASVDSILMNNVNFKALAVDITTVP